MYKHLLPFIVTAAILLPNPAELAAMNPPCTQSGQCDQCACDPPPPCPAIHPQWYFRSDALMLRRDVKGSVPSWQMFDPALTTVVTTDFLDQPFQAGPEFTIGHTFGQSPFSVEMSYFWLGDWDESLRFQEGTDYYAFRDFSSLDNGELNFYTVLDMPPSHFTTSFIVGLRYMRIAESFGAEPFGAVLPTSPLAFDVDTSNVLWGPQIGALVEIYAYRQLWVNFEIKGALCNNKAKGRNQNNASYELSGDSTSYVADFALTAVCRLTPHLTTRLGYQAIWVGDIAVAAENYDPAFETLHEGPNWLCRRGSVLYHGPHLGMELTW